MGVIENAVSWTGRSNEPSGFEGKSITRITASKLITPYICGKSGSSGSEGEPSMCAGGSHFTGLVSAAGSMCTNTMLGAPR